MFIQTEATPNPLTLKFLPGQSVLEDGPREFLDIGEATGAPLVLALFDIDGVRRVFLAKDFLAVTINQDVEWPHIKPAILGAIMDHYVSGQPMLTQEDGGPQAQTQTRRVADEDTSQIIAEIEDLLETKVRPAVARDGGDITFEDFDPQSGVLTLKMRGACAGCPSSTMTLKQGIETMMRHYVPEVTQVVQAA